MYQIQGLDVELDHRPEGYTSSCQPVDVGVVKPYYKRQWEKWEFFTMQENIICVNCHERRSPSG